MVATAAYPASRLPPVGQWRRQRSGDVGSGNVFQRELGLCRPLGPIDRAGVLRWLPLHRFGISQPKMLENPVNDPRVVNQGDHPHLVIAPWALSGVHLVNAIDQLGPGGQAFTPKLTNLVAAV